MADNFSLLPEWSRQEAVLLAWPHISTDWRPWLDAIEADYIELATAISQEVTPLILCQDQDQRHTIGERLDQYCKHTPRYFITAYNGTWCRDYGPLTVADQHTLKLLDFSFNGWGAKYESGADNDVNRNLQSLWKPPLKTVALELEGGSIDTDGEGTLLSTTRCLLASNRNKAKNAMDIEREVLEHLGMNRVLWLQHGYLSGDDTDSHIDNLARFCSPDTIVYAVCRDGNDEHYSPLQAMEKELGNFRQGDGSPYHLHAIALPSPRLDDSGARLPASYVNFLILNDSVIVPVFDCPEDTPAIETLQQCFPGKRLLTVPGNNLIRQFGGPHCATMQLPAGTLTQQVIS